MDAAVVIVNTHGAETAAGDLAILLERACELIVDAGKAGAARIVFPEAYLLGCPAWMLYGLDDDVRALHASALASALVIPGDVSDRLCRVAQRSQVAVAIGLVERDDATCYSTMLFIDAAGHICGHYRTPLDAGDQERHWVPVSRSMALRDQRRYAPEEWANVGSI
jgi:predicted amidohydrolase